MTTRKQKIQLFLGLVEAAEAVGIKKVLCYHGTREKTIGEIFCQELAISDAYLKNPQPGELKKTLILMLKAEEENEPAPTFPYRTFPRAR